VLTSKIATEISCFLIEDCFEIVSLFVRPGELGGYSYLSFRANEDIMRPYVSNFEVGRVEGFSCHYDGVN
jgi:hypothetical protein